MRCPPLVGMRNGHSCAFRPTMLARSACAGGLPSGVELGWLFIASKLSPDQHLQAAPYFTNPQECRCCRSVARFPIWRWFCGSLAHCVDAMLCCRGSRRVQVIMPADRDRKDLGAKRGTRRCRWPPRVSADRTPFFVCLSCPSGDRTPVVPQRGMLLE